MKLVPCTEEETRVLENTTTPVENLVDMTELSDRYRALLAWYR